MSVKQNSCVIFKDTNIKSPWFLNEKIKEKNKRNKPEKLVKKNKYKLASVFIFELPPRKIIATVGITEISKKIKKDPRLSQEKIIKIMINKKHVLEIKIEDFFM